MNTFEERRQGRIDRLRERAEAAEKGAESLYGEARKMASVIPMGQPILVGHHSEQSDRRYRDRIAGAFRKAAETRSKAKHYERKAEAAEHNTAISSDDPEALDKLRSKLSALEAYQEQMKADNRALRKAKIPPTAPSLAQQMRDAGVSEAGVEELCHLARICRFQVEPYMRHPAYALSNNNANIKRIRERIAELEQRATAPEAEPIEGDGWRITEDCEWGRILIEFDGKPSEEVRRYLKSYGWRWAPSRGAWVRHLNANGRAYAKLASEALPGLLLPKGSLKWWATTRGFKVFIRASKVWCWIPGRNVAQVAPVDNGRWMNHHDIYAPPWQCVELTDAQTANFEATARDCYCYQGVDRCDFCTTMRTPDGAPSSNGQAFWQDI